MGVWPAKWGYGQLLAQAGGGIRAVYSFAPQQGPNRSHTAAAPMEPGNPADSASQHNSNYIPPEHHRPVQHRRKDTSALAPKGPKAGPEHTAQGLQRTQSHPGLRRSQRRTLAYGH